MIKNYKKILSLSIVLLVLFVSMNSISATDDLNDKTSLNMDNHIEETNNIIKNNSNNIEEKNINTKKATNKENETIDIITKNNENTNDYYVSVMGNNQNNGTKDNPYKTIDKAINSSQENKTNNIYLSEGTFKLDGNTNLTINKNTNLIGASSQSTILDGSNINYLCNISDVNVTFTNITITNFYKKLNQSGTTEGIINNNGTLKLINVILTNNTVDTALGINETQSTIYTGIILSIGEIQIENMTASFNNINNTYGKSLSDLRKLIEWGGVITSYKNVNIINSNFYNNTGSRSSVVYAHTLSKLNVNNSTFKNNKAYYCGGVFLTYLNTTTTINNSYFENNNGTNAGGIIYQQRYSNMIVENSTFNHNYANTGGALYTHHYSNLTTNNCIFTNNTAKTGSSILGADEVILNIHNATFKNNQALQGAVMGDEKCEINVYNSLFENNNATFGGAVFGDLINNITIKDSILTNNTATYGGAIYATINSSIIITNNTFSDNKAENGSVIFVDNTDTIDEDNPTPAENITSTITSTNNTFLNNIAINNELIVNYPGGTFVSENNNYENNNLKTNIILTTTNTMPGKETILTAKVTTATDYNLTVNNGFIILKINGVTLKDENNQTIRIPVINGMATYNYTIPANYSVKNYVVTAVYSNNTNYTTMRTNATLTLNKLNATLTLNSVSGKVNSTITLNATITDGNNNTINKGKVIFKINGKTLKDENNQTIYVYVTNGIATLNYTIPPEFTSKNYTITAIFSDKNYERTENSNILTVEKSTSQITIDPIITTYKTPFNITATIKNNITQIPVTDGKAGIKINGKTVVNNLTLDSNGTFNYTINNIYKIGTHILEIMYSGGKNTINSRTNTTITIKA